MMHLLVIVSSDLFGLLARCSIKILHSNYTPQTKDKNHLSSYAFLSPLIGGPTPPLLSHTKAAYMYHEPCCSCIPLSFNVIQHAAIRSRSQEQHAATRTSLPSVLGAVRRPAPFRDCCKLILHTMKSLADLMLVFSAVHTGLLRERQTCLQVCATSQCPAPPHAR